MLLSVVVATYKRRDVLKITLQKLAEQTLASTEYEVIVVDDGSPDDTAEMVQSMIAEMPYSLRFYRHANRGPGATENRGIREAKTNVVLLIADDIHLEPTALESHVQFHQERPDENLAALGCVLQSPELPANVFQRNWDPFKYFELAGATELPYWKFWACQISLKRSFMLKYGLFKEHKGAAHEDVELGYRLCKSGLKILYHPEALGYHYHLETLESAANRAYERGKHWRFIEENVPDPQIWVKYHIFNTRTLKYHYQTFRNLSQSSLPAEDRNLPWLLLRQLIRWIVFNRFTVGAWMGFIQAAERSPALAALMSPYVCRGVVSYHFIRGCRDEFRSRQNAPPSAIASQETPGRG